MEALVAFDPNNYPFIFDYNLDHIVLHITDSNAGKSPQSKQYLSNLKVSSARKLDYFTEILKFTFGSNPSSSKSDENQNKLALSLYRHWVSLSSSSPIYLFEVCIIL